MAAIYEPQGAAREYSPLALNYVRGCDHGCVYCLDGDTLILLSNGSSIPIRDIKIGQDIIGVSKHHVSRSWGNRYTTTQVLNKVKTFKTAYKITLENGTELICSGDHRWLTDRGWKYTTPKEKGQRPFITTKNYIRGIGSSIKTPIQSEMFKIGYLSGMIKGDGTRGIYDYSGKYKRKNKESAQKKDINYSFRLALKDYEALQRSKSFLDYFGIQTNDFKFQDDENDIMKGIRINSKSSFDKINKIVEPIYENNSEWLRGWLSGSFDAEGSYSTVIRISNFNSEYNRITQKAFNNFSFDSTIEEKGVRMLGGDSELVRFFQLTNPAIERKFTLSGTAVSNNFKIVSIECLNEKIEMYDIMTGTENFIANGLISHNCYVPKMMKRFDSGYIHSNVYMKEQDKLKKEITLSCKKFKNSQKQVFLSFTTDPYSHFNNETKFTRWVLEKLLEYNIPVSILTKGGYNVLQDLDIIKKFGENIQVGGSLTFMSNEDALKWEKNSSMPYQRFDTLKQLHEAGVKTWASMEPVIIPDQSLEIMEITHNYIDSYKIGKLNHFPKYESKFDWADFLVKAVSIMRKYNKPFYIKKDLLEFKPKNLYLSKDETDMDFLALKNYRLSPAIDGVLF